MSNSLNEVYIDVRGLEPPEPMVRILSLLEELPSGATVVALTDRKPVHLLDILVERNYEASRCVAAEKGYATTIVKHVAHTIP